MFICCLCLNDAKADENAEPKKREDEYMRELVCENECVHDDVVSEIKEKMPDEETVFELAELFKIFGDSTRTKILSCLELSELCVCDICSCLNLNQSAISHQLRVLRQAKLVKARKKGKEVIYSLDDDHVSKIYECALMHIKE